MTNTNSSPRRRKGEGGIDRHHRTPYCPPAVDGVVPDHKCTQPYRARVWVTTAGGGRKRKAVYGATEREVLNKIKALHVAEHKGEVVAATMTVRDWMRTDAAEHGLHNYWTLMSPTYTVNTRKAHASKINAYIIPALGNRTLTALQPEHVRAMLADMAKRGLSSGTCRVTYAILRGALKKAMHEDKVGRNVCDRVAAPSAAPTTERAALVVEDAWKVLRAAGDNPRWWVALLCGLRQGEALALRWRDVVLDGDGMAHLVVRESVSRVPGGGLHYGKPKTAASTDRVVPLLADVATRLRAHRATAYANGADADSLVFTAKHGGPVYHSDDWAAWKALLATAGVEHTPLHAARNTTAHLLEDAGVSDRVVAEILGHSSVQMTHRYQRGNLPAKVTAMAALEAHLASKDSAA